MRKRIKLFAVFMVVVVVVSVGVGYFQSWMRFYPQYLMFMDKYRYDSGGEWRYRYSVELTSFITSLRIPRSIDVEHAGYFEACAYWRIFSMEENFQGKWNLEVFDKRWQENKSVVWTLSHTFTENITKRWQFWSGMFQVEIWRRYVLSGENMNNQIIIDVNNNGIHPIPNGIQYGTERGLFTYKVLEAVPNNFTIQTGHPTETQINFYGASDRDVRFHREGQTEYIRVMAEVIAIMDM